jgi:hypothetical protein
VSVVLAVGPHVDSVAAGWKHILSWWNTLLANDYFSAALNSISEFSIGHKIFLLIILLFFTLYIIARVNGIKKTKQLDDMILRTTPDEKEGTVRVASAKFENGEITRYNNLNCTVNFWDSHIPGFFSRHILRRKPPVSGKYTLTIRRDNSGYGDHSFTVDSDTREKFDGYTQQHPEKTPDTIKWAIQLKKDNGILFLLNHPDPNTRTTAWVVLVTSIFAIVQSALFEK